ncbi:aldolase [Metabacillus halosaccharovorans]|uniref:aldolase n=1 Tax=Metabacillus halosaccharovorans TaxID=930124 RepID=UPI0034CD0F8C
MIDSKYQKVYQAFGLNIMSDIRLPELPASLATHIDVSFELADLHAKWSEVEHSNRYFLIKEKICLFKIPEVAIYLVQDGNMIKVSPFAGANEDQIRLYLLGTCMGALLIQKRILPLHGSAIAIEGKAYAIVGESGAGKSTLASNFLRLGYELISDDIIPITFNEAGIPIVTPAYPQQKLWLESLEQFGMESNKYRPIFDRETKFAVPVSQQFATQSLPLAGVVELIKTNDVEIEFKPIQNLSRLQTLYTHTYRNFFIGRSGLMNWHFQTTVKMCEHIDIYQLCRPTTRFTAHELTELILASLYKEEKVYG